VDRSYISIDGLAINIEDHGGHGIPVLLVHGLGGSAGNWSLVAPRCAEFARVLAVDLPGHGRSGPAPVHDIDTHVRTVIAVIELMGPEKVALVGNSMGGLVAEFVASRRPDLLSCLLLLSPATPPASLSPPSSPVVAARLLLRSLPAVGPLVTAASVARRGPRRQIEEMLEVVMEDPSRLPADAVERTIETATLRRTMPWAPKAFADSTGSIRRLFLRRHRYVSMIDGITVPTTLVYGACDKVVVPASLRWLARRRSDWRAVELPDTGHTVMFERPDVALHELLRLLERSGARPPAR
jgi:pimeloyl-ACP methyl ester carboxylesterase